MSKIEKFARFVMKHSKLFLAAYIIVAIMLVPYAIQSTQQLTTNEAAYLPKDVESQRANDILKEAFNNTDESGVIIVLHSKSGQNIVTKQVFNLVMDIRDWVLHDWKVDGNSIVSNVSDIFTFTMELYNSTIDFYSMQLTTVNMTASILWGLPYIFGSYWQAVYYYTSNTALADANASHMMNITAYQVADKVKSNSEIPKEAANMYANFILNYTNAFIQTWAYMRSNAMYQLALPPNTPINIAITNIVRNLVNQIISNAGSNLPETFAFLLNLTATDLDYDTWSQPNQVYGLYVDFMRTRYKVSDSIFEEQFMLGVFNESIFVNKTVYQYFYWSIVGETEAPSLFPFKSYSFMRSLYISKDNDTMIVSITVTSQASGFTASEFEPYMESLRGYLANKEISDLEILTTGIIPLIVDNTSNAKEDVERIDLITFALALIILLIIYRGIPVSVFPLLLMGLTVIIARAILVLLSGTIGLEINDVTLAMMTTVIIGAGVDYTIFLISRYNENRRRGHNKEDSIISVVRHAGKSVLLSGGTVMIAFGSLMLSSFDFLRHVGMGIMTGVGITLFVALTLTPSILTIFGDSIFWPSHKEYKKNKKYVEGRYEKMLKRIGRWTIKHSGVVVLVALLVTVPAIYIYESHGTTYDFMALTREGTPSKTGFEILQDEIGAQAFSTTDVVAVFNGVNFTTSDGTINVTLVKKYIKPVSEELLRISGVKCVRSAYMPMGYPIPDKLEENSTLEDFIFLAAARGYVSENGTIALFTVCIEPAPYSEDAFTIINFIRSTLKDVKSKLGVNVEFFVGGVSATYKDISDIVNEDFNVLVTVVIIGIIVFLFVALRSLLIPIRLEITILLSIVWAIALSMIFWSFYAGLKLVWFIPLFMFTVLNGLGMDYDIFLVTRIEEERIEKRRSEEDAIVEAIASTGKIISIAGIIMATAFGSLMLTLSPPTRQIGLTLALGVLIDAFIVRIILVPAIMAIAGKWNWWPRKISAEQ